ncbi:MAG: hypothetical protein PHR77_13980 [Kiritimatiellae bacterium]|nr:hypothetical protein [Kiritimatiellia bacterium]MDD5522406.1 hypothetical protein [Kiritimatiellia bacterium]
MTTLENNSEGKGPSTPVHLVLSRKAIFLLAVFLFVPWLLTTVVFWKTGLLPKISQIRQSLFQSDATGRTIMGHPGPWGELEYTRIVTEMPNELAFTISDGAGPELQRWFFKGYSKEQVTDLLQSSGLSPEHLSSLMQTNRWEITADGCWIKPSEDVILGMNENARRKIYLTLTRFTENEPQRTAFNFRPQLLNERIANSGLSNKSVELFKSLLYHQGSFLLFADLDYALQKLPNDEEKRRFIKMVSRKSTLLAKLRVSSVTDVDRLTAYWGTGGRAKDLGPLFDSLARVPGGCMIDFVHLLPPFARRRLYTYPMAQTNAPVSLQDCNWSTMNFFNSEPDDRFVDRDFIINKLQTDYYPISGPEHLGDLIFLTLPTGESIHSAVFIADNIVFTKNGKAISQPWIFMKLEDLMELYSAPYPPEEPLKVFCYRMKTF